MKHLNSLKTHHMKPCSSRVLARNFKTCVWDSLLSAVWRPRMKNHACRYQNIAQVMALRNACRTDSYVWIRDTLCTLLVLQGLINCFNVSRLLIVFMQILFIIIIMVHTYIHGRQKKRIAHNKTRKSRKTKNRHKRLVFLRFISYFSIVWNILKDVLVFS